MHPEVRAFGEQLAKLVFNEIDRGAPFVLFTIERVHIYVWDRKGRVAYGRELAFPIMTSYTSRAEAEAFWDMHAEESYNSSETSACITPYFPAHSNDPSTN